MKASTPAVHSSTLLNSESTHIRRPPFLPQVGNHQFKIRARGASARIIAIRDIRPALAVIPQIRGFEAIDQAGTEMGKGIAVKRLLPWPQHAPHLDPGF